jgi:N-acyl-L-homoserine lactone synthetase
MFDFKEIIFMARLSWKVKINKIIHYESLCFDKLWNVYPITIPQQNFKVYKSI